MAKGALQRRDFLASAGALFLSGLSSQQGFSLERADRVFASAAKMRNGDFVAALVSDRGTLISSVTLPGRGHDIVQCPVTDRFVAFARRPGNFAVVFDRGGAHLATIMAPIGRHFYGHGIFNASGQLLYATENDFEAARGIIGVYDATDGFKRIGEFFSGGVGPHDVLLTPDGRYLCVANGGIETHPDFGREKLNLTTMQSNICWIDVDTGASAACHALPSALNRLSLRHMASGKQNEFWVAGQYQGGVDPEVPLLARMSLDEPLDLIALPAQANQRLAGYVGSIALSSDKERIALTSSVGDVGVIFDINTGMADVRAISNAGGAAWPPGGQDAVISTGDGNIMSGDEAAQKSSVLFDNHIRTVRE